MEETNNSLITIEKPNVNDLALKSTQNLAFFNINTIVQNIPAWFHKGNAIIFLIFPILFFFIHLKIIFFHFIPMEINENWLIMLTVVFPIMNLAILKIIALLKKEKILLSTVGLLLFYYNITFSLTIVVNFFQLTSNDLIIHFVSILIQGLFIFFWTLSISLQYYSWEKSLFLAIIQNYLLLLIF